MIFYITAIANGFLNTINNMVNVKAGECLGPTNGALINYVEATILSFLLIFVSGNGAELNFSHMAEVPVFFYTGSICGLVAMIFLIIGTSRTGAMLSTILTLLGSGLCFLWIIQHPAHYRYLFDHCRDRLEGTG